MSVPDENTEIVLNGEFALEVDNTVKHGITYEEALQSLIDDGVDVDKE